MNPTNRERTDTAGSNASNLGTPRGASNAESELDEEDGVPLVRQGSPTSSWRLRPPSKRTIYQRLGLTGTERTALLGHGSLSCAEAIKINGVQPPRYLWYMISGAICDVLQLGMDMVLHQYIVNDSICWALGFGLSIVFRHTSHRHLVFGDYVGGYTASLLRMYGGYSVIIVLSTLFNLAVTKVTKMSHYVAWILTLLWTGIANYFILKRMWSFGGTPSTLKQ